MDNYLKELFINEAKPALKRHSGGSGGGSADFDAFIEGREFQVISNATSISANVFGECDKLTTADFPVATSISNRAFEKCYNLTTVNFPNCTSIGNYTFSNCSNLTTADFPLATSIGNYVFEKCSNLTTVNFPNCTSIGTYAFSMCSKLITANFPLVTSMALYAFGYCYNLTTADFPLVTSIGSYTFGVCSSLTALILRNETMCTLLSTNAFKDCYHILGTTDSTYNPRGAKDGYIYVPRALVDTYKSATNWSTYATQFRALEDYTVDGTISGELDTTKI